MNKKPLEALRLELQRQNLTGFIVPHADEYQNEYLPPCAERLAWLTGFTGSDGTAIILRKQAAIFVDGRYILQVQNEIDPKIFKVFHKRDQPLTEWIASTLKNGDKLGYDPWLHTFEEVNELKRVCCHAGVQLVSCESNPIDAIWKDRPEEPITLTSSYPLEHAGRSSKKKREQISLGLKAENIGAAVLTAPDSIAWLLNIRGRDVPYVPVSLGFAVFYTDGSLILFTNPKKINGKITKHLGQDVTIYPTHSFKAVLDDLAVRKLKILCDNEKSPSWIVERLKKGGGIVVNGRDPCTIPKACKNQTEIKGIQEVHRWDGAAVCQFLAWLAKDGAKGRLTELDAQNRLDAIRRETPSCLDLSFPTISASGPHGAIVHYHATEKTNRFLKPGDLYLVDSGGQYLGGTTDVTRTVAIGRPTDEQKSRYTHVLKGHIALSKIHFPRGTSGLQLDAIARLPLWQVGIDYDHATGHGVGCYLSVHEGPQRVSKVASMVPLQEGMVLSNEPGFYKKGEYGIRIENLMVVVDSSKRELQEQKFLHFKTLTLVPYDKRLIEKSLLTREEKGWLAEYYDLVNKEICPLVDSKTSAWLKQETCM
ncbi:aminopeptidase P family protein [Nitrospira sp. T9]|uniref:aminopeptidase P family protein n=1 Tax=unclassified Nitrospira TaxID=2652172 RepID=UPI003F9559DC